MRRSHILALMPLPAVACAALAEHYQVHVAAQGPSSIDEHVPLNEVVAVITNGATGMDEGLMASLPALRIVSSFGAGYENIDLAAAKARGVLVTNAPGTNDETVADHALGLMLVLSRGFCQLDSAVRKGAWESAQGARPSLFGATIGVIGMGRIGQGIARRAQAFGMRVMYHARNERVDVPYEFETDLIRMAGQADFLVAACPGGTTTRHIVDAQVLSALGASGYLINISRGSVVNTDDLITALRENTIAGAGLDVFETEPVVPQALRELANVIMTPHMAGRSPISQQAQTNVLLSSLDAVRTGKHPEFLIA